MKFVIHQPIRAETGDLSSRERISAFRETYLPATSYSAPHVWIIDLAGKLMSPSSLEELIVPLGQLVRGGAYGDLRVVIVSADPSVRRFVGLLAKEHGFPMFVAADRNEVDNATPVGDLTRGDTETLDELMGVGGAVTIAAYAQTVGLEATAANNRLVNLEKKGYVYRVRRPRSAGDLFVDPRRDDLDIENFLPPERAALVAAGISTDPYSTETLRLEGAAAERARELLERHTKDAPN